MDFLWMCSQLRKSFAQVKEECIWQFYSMMQRPSSTRCHRAVYTLLARCCVSGFYQRATHQRVWLEKKRHSGDIEETPVRTFGKAITWLASEKWYMPAIPVNGYTMVGNMFFHWAFLQVAKSLHLTSNQRWGLPIERERKIVSLLWE